MNREIITQALEALKSAANNECNFFFYKIAANAVREELAKPVNEFNPDWNMIKPLVERVNELEAELHELKKQEPVAWNENVNEMPFNTYCKAVVDWYSYSTDGDTFLEGNDVKVIVVKYKFNEDLDDIVFIHEGNKQYKNTRCEVLKWKSLYTSPPPSDYHEGWEEGYKAAKLAKPVNEFNPDWDQQAVLIERIRELEAELHESKSN
jgi:hypothetical protein